MTLRRPLSALSALATLLLACSAQAHVPFLKPNQFKVEHPRLQIESAFTEYPFQADFAMDSDGFVMVLPNGQVQALQPSAKTSAAVYLEPKLPEDGTYRITTGVRKGPALKAIDVKGKLYFADDVERMKGEKTQMRYYSRADAYIAKGAPAYQARPLNDGVEIIPQSAPTELLRGGSLVLQVLRDGKPLPFARLIVARDGEHYEHRRIEDLYDAENVRGSNIIADAQGMVTFTPPQAGLYFLLANTHERINKDLWNSYNAELTLEVGLPVLKK